MTAGSLVAGLNVLDAATYWNVAYPHPFVSGNRFESLIMKPTSVWGPGTVTPYGDAVFLVFSHSILAMAAPSGTGWPLAGMPSAKAFIITAFPTIAFMQPVFDVPHPPASSG